MEETGEKLAFEEFKLFYESTEKGVIVKSCVWHQAASSSTPSTNLTPSMTFPKSS